MKNELKKMLFLVVALVAILFSIASCKADIPAGNPPYVPPKGNFIVFYSDTEFAVTPYNGWSGGSESALEFSTDKSNWEPLDKTKLETKTAVQSGDKYYLYFRGTDNNTMGTSFYYDMSEHKSYDNFWILEGENVYCSGNIENLLDYKTVEKGEHPQMKESCFSYMFYSCIALIQAPELSATTLSDNCYEKMFYLCISLVTAPELPADKLASECYYNMFSSCESLVTAPELPATTLADSCYQGMFYECKILAKAPELPATTLKNNCYEYMFEECSALSKAPVLSATTLTNSCYQNMFSGCSALVIPPELPATTLADYCYYNMFLVCSSLSQAPELKAATLAPFCYSCMFGNCEKINSVTCLATNISASNCVTSLVYGTATNANGILKIATGTIDMWNKIFIPSNWTIQEIQ